MENHNAYPLSFTNLEEKAKTGTKESVILKKDEE